MLDTLMDKFTQEMEIEGSFATEVPGVFAIPVHEGVDVFVSEIPGGFSIRASLTECPKKELDEFFSFAMISNLFGNGTDGAVIGLDEEGKTLILTQDVDYEVTAQDFNYMLEDFFNQVEFWLQEIQAYGKK